MTKCLVKALNAVDLQHHVDVFRLLGYDSAGALAHFHHEHFKQIHFNEQESIRFHALLDVLKQATSEGKVCPHYCKSTRQSRPTRLIDSTRVKDTNTAILYRNGPATANNNYACTKKQSHDEIKSRVNQRSIDARGRTSSASPIRQQSVNGFMLARPASAVEQQHKMTVRSLSGPKTLTNRPAVEHVKVRIVLPVIILFDIETSEKNETCLYLMLIVS
jgi:hypothetical protein